MSPPPPVSAGSGGAARFAQQFPLFMRTALILAWLLAAACVFTVGKILLFGGLGQDAHAYWFAAQGELLYNRPPITQDAYLYSPVFLSVIRPLALLPYPGFLALWIALLAVVLIWLVRPLRARWAIPVALCCVPEILLGNIYVLLAAATVLGVRRPAAWAFPILTKVSTGVGLLWFAARGDWRGLARGVGAVALIVGVSYLFEPGHWHAWVRFLLEHRGHTADSSMSFVLRCLLAVVLVVVGARRNLPWLLAPAVLLASPVLAAIIPATVLVAIPRLIQPGSAPERPRTTGASRTGSWAGPSRG
ncbi:glycosyltransferase family 87 protein [Arthrobacter sp. TMN-37]